MIRANISKNNKQQIITAAGSVPEIMNDMAILINGIYTHLRNADQTTALLFRTGMINMITDYNGPVWQTLGNQTGIIFQLPPQEDQL